MGLQTSLRYKVGDIRPVLRATVYEGEGSTVQDWTGAASVKFYLYDTVAGALVSGFETGKAAAFDADKTNGKLIYTWVAADTATKGRYRGWFVADWTGSGANQSTTAVEITILDPQNDVED